MPPLVENSKGVKVSFSMLVSLIIMPFLLIFVPFEAFFKSQTPVPPERLGQRPLYIKNALCPGVQKPGRSTDVGCASWLLFAVRCVRFPPLKNICDAFDKEPSRKKDVVIMSLRRRRLRR